VASIYQNETCKFLYTTMRALFEDIVVQMQEDMAVKKLKADLELQIQGFKNRCIQEGN
jgi:hypothetical protein